MLLPTNAFSTYIDASSDKLNAVAKVPQTATVASYIRKEAISGGV